MQPAAWAVFMSSAVSPIYHTEGPGCTAVLLGDAAHDGGLALMQGSDCPPGLHFADADALAHYLKENLQEG